MDFTILEKGIKTPEELTLDLPFCLIQRLNTEVWNVDHAQYANEIYESLGWYYEINAKKFI